MELAWVNASELDRYWRNDDSYVCKYGKEPNSAWFVDREKKDGLILPEVILLRKDGTTAVSISANRHRTRWLISDKQLTEIPVGMREGDIDAAIELGLVIRRIAEDEAVNLPVKHPH